MFLAWKAFVCVAKVISGQRCCLTFAAIVKAVEAGEDVNEVEGAGNTPLHCAAYEGWLEGCELLLNLGAKVNASNNAGERPWHWAKNMGHTHIMEFLEKVSFEKNENSLPNFQLKANFSSSMQAGAARDLGEVLVQDHVPKVKDFYQKECWAHHPKPHADYMEWRIKQDELLEAERNKLIPGM